MRGADMTPGHDDIRMISKQRISLYEDLTDLALEQRQILVEGRHEDLAQNIERQEPLAAALMKLEQSCPQLNEDDPLAVQAGKASERLRAAMEVNKQLLANAIGYIRFSIGLVAQLATDKVSYDPQTSDTPNSAIVLDTKV